jgi:glycosyltransferase involved in cell wall biosynthesis
LILATGKIEEAMLAGLPVVASDVGGVGDAVSNDRTGLLVPPEDPAALARAVRELRANRERTLEMGRAGRPRALERFSLHRMAAEFEALYAELMQ